ncbi:hypothetical protein [Pantoea sp. RHCKP32]|uniref:hypothetical protein n=1 Tax=Pantoea sp. RHCKP32 TaxID=3425182 RepID=UPI003DA1900B
MAHGYQFSGHQWSRWQQGESLLAQYSLTLSCPPVEGVGAVGFNVKLTGRKEGGSEVVLFDNSYLSLAEAAQAYNSIKESSLTS